MMLQLRLRVIVMVFYTLCLVSLWLVRSQSCASFEFAWLGIMPMQVIAVDAAVHHAVMSAFVTVSGTFFVYIIQH